MERECVLNRERQGLRISVKSSLSGLRIKDGLDKAEAAMPYVYIPGELTKDSEGYSVYIRQKISVKEYLKTESPDEKLVYRLVCSLQHLWRISNEENIPFYNFLFDYDAVFLDNPYCAEFVYLPGARLNKDNNSVKDMMLLLLMQCCDNNTGLTDYLSDIIEKIEIWEEQGGDFPGPEIDFLTGRKNMDQWKQMSIATVLALMVAAGLFVATNGILVWPLWMLVSAGVIIYTSPLKKRKLTIEKSCYLYRGPKFNNGEITVGRDINWADFCIKNLLVSRRHAVVINNGGSLAVRDLFSSNGTYVDGKRLQPGEEVDVRPGQVVDFGNQCRFCVKYKILFFLR